MPPCPFAAAILILDIMFVVHAAKTGRLSPWAYIILLLPGVGVIAYVVVELVPEWMLVDAQIVAATK